MDGELIQPVAHETTDRIITGLVTALPFLLLAVAAWQVWNEALHWRDLAILASDGSPGSGSRSASTACSPTAASRRARCCAGIFAALGSAAIEGPVISWVADHRKHHAFSDEPGDPHSPHVGHGVGWRGTLRGLFHAHIGWLFIHTERGSKQRFAPDLIEDPVVSFVDRTFLLWAVPGSRSRSRSATCSVARWSPGYRRCCGAARCGCSSSTTSPTASTRSATSSAASSTPRTSRATFSGSPAYVRRGLAQQPPRLSDLGRAWDPQAELDPSAM